jgi:lysophospholipase L1-like esterase
MSTLRLRGQHPAYAVALLLLGLRLAPLCAQEPAAPLRTGDRVAWIGSSSTNIGVWPKTMEFLLRTRQPELKLTFKKFSTGGGTFATGVQKLDGWLKDFPPTVVVFNYGSNDAGAGEKGLAPMKANIEKCVAMVQAAGARVMFTDFQPTDVRKTDAATAERRRLYAETVRSFAKEKGWPAFDVFHPLEAMQKQAQAEDMAYTILKDKIHLTAPAYIAWGYFLYDGLHLPGGRSSAALHADGRVKETTACKITDVQASERGLSFVRADKVLPLLPPGPLPPRKLVPLEKCSPYLLSIMDLPAGTYALSCEGRPLGSADATELARGVNLNTLLLDAKQPAPWEALARQLWEGKDISQIGATRWRFEVKRN